MNRTPSKILLIACLAACGGGGDKPDAAVNPNIDSGHPNIDASSGIDSTTQIDGSLIDGSLIDGAMIDGSSSCTTTALGTQDIVDPGDGTTAIVFGGTMPTGLGDGGTARFSIEYYSGIETTFVAAYDLAAGNQANYMTCAECVRVETINAAGDAIVREYFQSGGTMTLTQDPVTTGKMLGTITNLALTEVTIDPNTFLSTPVVGGKCLTVGNVTLDADSVPATYTCAANTFNDGATCNCMCGTPTDPDCAIAGAPVVGCTGAQVCSAAGTCTNPASNNTCQTATALTLGTPMTGTTAGATSNYDSGLETATCDEVAQPGADVAYSVALTAGTKYTFSLSGVDAAFDPSIAIVGPGAATVCDASPVACLAGADKGLGGADESFDFTPATTGTYFLIVDTFSATATGAFTITAKLAPPPPTNDTCQTATALTIGTPLPGTTVGALPNYNSGLETATCTTFSQAGADVAYSVVLAAGTSYTFALSNVQAGFDPSIALLGPGTAAAVCDASPVACLAGADAGLGGEAETFTFTPTTAGTYFVIVDAFSTTKTGTYTVTVSTP